MIAPVRERPKGQRRSSGGLAAARRAVADMMFSPADSALGGGPRVAPRVAWGFAAWTVVVAAWYLAVFASRIMSSQ